ncbi:hypothetical protein [Rhodococcus globerulus]|uniref:hypothetical protein n=1 Tax=Rhodococcus globerulus TaxID=33008 RepID=UPI0030189D31
MRCTVAEWAVDEGGSDGVLEGAPPAFDVACPVCGDGPILAATFAQTARGGILPDPVHQWLTVSGWTVVPELRCPDQT